MDQAQFEKRILEAHTIVRDLQQGLEAGGEIPPMEWAWLDVAMYSLQRCIDVGGKAAQEIQRNGDWRIHLGR